MDRYYKLYQLSTKEGEVVDYLFDSWKYAKSLFKFSDYKITYEGIHSHSECECDDVELLEALFTKFNVARPKDFMGHSMSVSDVIKLDDKYYYCDITGWKDITEEVNKGE